jgi:hypothetical protein
VKDDDGEEGKKKEWEEEEGEMRRKKGLVMEATKGMRLLSVEASCYVEYVGWRWSAADLWVGTGLKCTEPENCFWLVGREGFVFCTVRYESGGTESRKYSDSSKNTRCG